MGKQQHSANKVWLSDQIQQQESVRGWQQFPYKNQQEVKPWEQERKSWEQDQSASQVQQFQQQQAQGAKSWSHEFRAQHEGEKAKQVEFSGSQFGGFRSEKGRRDMPDFQGHAYPDTRTNKDPDASTPRTRARSALKCPY
ncbi:hypothetical protein E2562_027073 [Oryza meyeriana var. granulata]|uniref:Uncharacterized protein n=1 Tax=Oryza meyeriana var. granulata TaxID=110450 RepID=A0A6G1EZ73_9ORYZ|nr:hypothetical protein E2562_027073 [Oryza meyeriana var. granulata]